jgi:hypothetical protein
MSKPANPTELVDRYLQAVRFWMPKTRKQDDLLAEFGEDLRSQVEARAETQGRPVTNDDVSEILKRCGAPMLVASRLGPKRHLIGPTLFPIYQFVLKMVLLWILVPVFVFIVGPANLTNAGGNWGVAIARTLGNLWTGLFIAAGVITLVFAILERTKVFVEINCKWDPSTLPPLEKQESKTSHVQAVCDLAFAFFGLIWLLLVPTYPYLILGPASTFLKAAPMWHTLYWPIVSLSVFTLLRAAITLASPQWDWFPKASQLVNTILTLLLLHYILQAAGQTPPGAWHPFVVLADNLRDSVHSIKIAAIVNASILLSCVGAWIGLSIAAPIQTWEFMSYLRKRTSGLHQPVTVQAH